AGCATLPAADEEPYRAVGTEPFWSITVAGGRMTYDSPDGGFSVRAPAPRELGDGRIYETRRITLQISHGECSDGMSDNRYPQTVRAVVDGRTLEGCGGGAPPPQSLAESSWSIVAIDGERVSGANYELTFGPAQLGGRAGCNRFSGSFAVGGGRLTAGPLMATRMACPEPRMTHERKVMALLAGPLAIRFLDGETLLLAGDAGSLRLNRRNVLFDRE
ncbi:MAG TPA: META domain-containing protein, partial [Allosphingosinicella sp.]|nr:META domain-containing protein [Allosphingosinicella sp.]